MLWIKPLLPQPNPPPNPLYFIESIPEPTLDVESGLRNTLDGKRVGEPEGGWGGRAGEPEGSKFRKLGPKFHLLPHMRVLDSHYGENPDLRSC